MSDELEGMKVLPYHAQAMINAVNLYVEKDDRNSKTLIDK